MVDCGCFHFDITVISQAENKCISFLTPHLYTHSIKTQNKSLCMMKTCKISQVQTGQKAPVNYLNLPIHTPIQNPINNPTSSTQYTQIQPPTPPAKNTAKYTNTCVVDVWNQNVCKGGDQLLWNQHQIVSFRNYQLKIKREIQSKVCLGMEEYYIGNFQEEMERKMGVMKQNIGKMEAEVCKCIQLFEENMKKYREYITCKIKQVQKIFGISINSRKKQLSDDRLLQQIVGCQSENKLIELVTQNWDIIKSLSINKNQKKNFKREQNQSENILTGCRELEVEMKKTCSMIEGVLLKNKKRIQGSLTSRTSSPFCSIKSSVLSSTNLTPQKIFSKSPQALSPCNKNLTPLQMKKQRPCLSGITNLINQQIKNLPLKSTKNSNEKLHLYGGNYKNKLIQTYYPWKQLKKQKNTQHEESNDLQSKFSHLGFGEITLQNKNNNPSFIIVGGFLNGEITDCIFRVNWQKRKKQLIGRLDQPLGNFGYGSRKLTKPNGQKYCKMFICGGLTQKNKVICNFSAYEFSGNLSIVQKQELPRFDQPRHSFTLTYHKSFLYAIGGIDYQNNALKKVEKFCQQTKIWSRVGELCYQRAKHRTVSLKTGLYVIGGWNGHSYLRSVERFCENKGTFQVVMEMREPRSNFGCLPCIESNSILVLGGQAQEQLSSCEYLSIGEKSSIYITALPSPNSNFSVLNIV